MYRIYWFSSLDKWELWSVAKSENVAYRMWDECCDRYPSHKAKITKETIIKEA